MDRHRVDADPDPDPDPNFHVDANSDPDQDWHQNYADPQTDLTISLILVGNPNFFTFNYSFDNLQSFIFLISIKDFISLSI